jgi:hypothetical protein
MDEQEIIKAFPCVHDKHLQEGMNLRDWFAGQIVSGITTNAGRNAFEFSKVKDIAEFSYELADAMMKARGE